MSLNDHKSNEPWAKEDIMNIYIVYCLDCSWASVERTQQAARAQSKVGGIPEGSHKVRIYKTWAPIKWTD